MMVGIAAAPVLAALHADCFPPGERWEREAMQQLLCTPGCFGWLAMQDGSPCGMALVRVAVDEAELLTIGVCPAHRGRLLGRGMLDAVCDLARARGAARMVLEVASGNQAALALYQGRGFTRLGIRRRYYPNGDDALVLGAALPLG